MPIMSSPVCLLCHMLIIGCIVLPLSVSLHAVLYALYVDRVSCASFICHHHLLPYVVILSQLSQFLCLVLIDSFKKKLFSPHPHPLRRSSAPFQAVIVNKNLFLIDLLG